VPPYYIYEYVIIINFEIFLSGIVDLSIGKAETVEMALMFLYGNQPTFTMENACALIELSDFFLIPTLKAAVINWLKDIEISPDKCFELLKMCTLYDADLPHVHTYIESHLTELILRPEMTQLTEESVRYILSAKIFSYVSVDDKIRFILLWIKQDAQKRKSIINELFGLVDQTEISKALFNEIKDDLITLHFSDIQLLEKSVDENIKDRTVIVMMPSFTCAHPFFCYDALQKKWYRLESTAFTNLQTRIRCMCEECKIVPGYTSGAKYCILTHDEKVHFLDTAADTCEECEIVINQEYCTNISPFYNFTDGGNIFYAHVDGIHLMDAKDYNACSDMFPYVPYVPNPFSDGTAENDVYIPARHSTVYRGKVKDGKIEMSPMFTLKNSTITNLCANQFIITVIIDQENCLVFDLNDHTLVKINVSIDSDVDLHASKDGAILLNSHRCILILRAQGSSSCSKYIVRQISFVNSDATYKFFNGYFIRFFRKDFYADFQMEIARYDSMKCADSIVDLIWEPCLLPKTDCCDAPNHKFTEMSFPRDKLRCDIDCPHCKGVIRSSRKFKIIRLRNIDEMFANEDSFDDGSYMYGIESSNDVTDISEDGTYLDEIESSNDVTDDSD
jgi:hypothetical protein